MTPDQVQKLHQAIELARGYGQCAYVDDGRPCCVIAQLAVLEGVPLERIALWNQTVVNLIRGGKAVELTSYPIEVLCSLQGEWDGVLLGEGAFDTMSRVRVKMHRTVDPTYADAAGL